MSYVWHASIRGDCAWVAATSQRRRSEVAATSQWQGRSDVAVARSQRCRSGEVATTSQWRDHSDVAVARSQRRRSSEVAVRSQQGRSEVAATFPEYICTFIQKSPRSMCATSLRHRMEVAK